MASAIQATKAPARKGSLACYRWYPKVSRIQAKAAQDVGRGSETLMTFARGDLFKAARRFVSGESRKALVVTAENNEVVVKSAANIPGVQVAFANVINVYDILNAKKLVVDKAALAKIEEVFA